MRIALLTIELLGVAAVVAGVAMVFCPAAFVVGGLAVVLIVERQT